MKLEKIINIVNEEFNVDIREKKRNRKNMNALKTYVYLARENTRNNLEEIGRRVNRHYSNVIHHYSRGLNIIELMKYDEELEEKFNNCERRFKDMKVKIINRERRFKDNRKILDLTVEEFVALMSSLNGR